MRVLVTDAVSYIGGRVCGQLLDAGYTVVGIDNLNHAYDVRLKYWRLSRLREQHLFTFHHLDIADHAALTRVFVLASDTAPPFDAVINLATRASVRPSVNNLWVYLETNVTGTLNLLELCRAHGVRQFVLASTSSLYGARNPLPFREDADTDGPLSPYAASKKAVEVLCYTYHRLYGLDVAVLRYFTVHGPADPT